MKIRWKPDQPQHAIMVCIRYKRSDYSVERHRICGRCRNHDGFSAHVREGFTVNERPIDLKTCLFRGGSLRELHAKAGTLAMNNRDTSSETTRLVSDPDTMTTQRPSSFEDPRTVNRDTAQLDTASATSIDRGLIAAMVGHELREPLNAIISFLSVTLQERVGPLNDLQSEFLRSTESAARRLERRIDDVQVALLDGDALNLRQRWINPNTRVVATCRELEWAADHFGIEVHTDLEQSRRNPGVWADPDRLDQILINLIENAIRYAEPGSEVNITTRFGDHGYWRLLVENDIDDSSPDVHPEN